MPKTPAGYDGNDHRNTPGGGARQVAAAGPPFSPVRTNRHSPPQQQQQQQQQHHLHQTQQQQHHHRPPYQQQQQNHPSHPNPWHYNNHQQGNFSSYMGPPHPVQQEPPPMGYGYANPNMNPQINQPIFASQGYGQPPQPAPGQGGMGINFTPPPLTYFNPPPMNPTESSTATEPASIYASESTKQQQQPQQQKQGKSKTKAKRPPSQKQQKMKLQKERMEQQQQQQQKPAKSRSSSSKVAPKTPKEATRGGSKKLPGTNPFTDDTGKNPPHTPAAAGAAPPSTGASGGGKKKRKPIEQKRAKRRTSSAASAALSLTIVSDEHPDRIVNPLLEIPEPTTGGEPVHGAELLAPIELAFHDADTFPLSYLARLLGFDVPIPETTQPVNFPTPLPPVESLPLLQKDVFHTVPPPPALTQNSHRIDSAAAANKIYRKKVTDIGDATDKYTLDYMDPVYAYILKHGFSSPVLKSPTSTRVAKFAAQQRQQKVIRERVVKQAREILKLSDDWTFSDWTSFVEHHHHHHSNTTSSSVAALLPFASSSAPKRNARPRFTLDGTKVYSNPPPQAFGIIAMYKGKAVAILKYQFQWYQLLHEKESEIAMVIEGLGKRTTLKETVSVASEHKKQSSDAVTPVPTTDAVEIPTAKSTAITNNNHRQPPQTTVSTTTEVNQPKNEQPPTITAEVKPVPESETTQTHSNTMEVVSGTEKIAGKRKTQGKKPKDNASKASTADEAMSDTKSLDMDVTTTGQDAKPAPAADVSLEQKVAVPIVVEEEPIPDIQPDDSVLLTMLALALEHTRACDVLYGLWDVPKQHVELTRKAFRMVELPLGTGQTGQPMLCDLTKCSSRLAFLMKDAKEGGGDDGVTNKTKEPETISERLLVRLPVTDEAKAMLANKLVDGEIQRSTRALDKASATVMSGATGMARLASVAIRVVLDGKNNDDKNNNSESKDENENTTINSNEKRIKCFKLGEDGTADDEELKMPADVVIESPLDILRCFPISKPQETKSEEPDPDDEILNELLKKQTDLLAAEQGLEPCLRSLMSKVVEGRLEFEKPERKKALEESKRILRDNEKIIERRKEMDLAWQEQLEKDMNAVCNICNDGEVTPDNQILFCEACNVAIHQMCYGIERVPEGDYYCIACRYFGRDKMQEDLASRLKRNPSATAVPLAPLPICCELCPIKQGAYIRTETEKLPKKPSDSKWVHMACAKWQGLPFLDRSKPEVVEDVAPLKIYFRKKDIACDICQGKRGAYHNCRYEGCEKWLHVTCARAIGTCEVVHGEDVEGPVAENPWSLMCTEHSNIDPETLTKEPVPHEQLVRAASEFPDDVVPKPPPQEVKPFHKLNGQERAIAFEDPDYERKVITDWTTKKFAGARCEVCDTAEDDGKNLFRCSSCSGVVCVTCKLTKDDCESDKRFFKCPVCQSHPEKRSTEEVTERPQCSLCFQKCGLLLDGWAKPINKISHWKNNPKDFAKSLFAKDLWAHYTCAFWLKGLQVDGPKARVDMSNAIMSNGRGFVLQTNRCLLCGGKGGLKAKCNAPGCRSRGERTKAPHFHITCARQAGLEVNHSDSYEGEFYAHCYVHGGNEFNLRAKIEDLVELEKRRSGKKMTRRDSPMNTFDASRLMNHSIVVMRVLGWAWRWAEWWVEYESNWEPLLEPGQKEKEMTKKELKIVDSTQESRCEDARKCRLGAFGAALRNRCYDTDEGFDNESLANAIRAVMSIPSLVGPFEPVEIDFLVEWLGRAYRSKSHLLGFGDDKIPVTKDAFCVFIDDKTPKFELGGRPIPGKKQSKSMNDDIFEIGVNEPDDYLKPEVNEHGVEINVPPLKIKKKPVKYKKDPSETKKDGKRSKEVEEEMSEEEEPPKKRGRQPKAKDVEKPKAAKARDDTQSSIGDKRSSVASLIPSAVRKRDRPPKRLESSPPRKSVVTKNIRLLQASIVFEELNSPTGLKKSRRGRPPKVWELPLVVTIGGEAFHPDRGTGKNTKRKLFSDELPVEDSSGLDNEMTEESEQTTGDEVSTSAKTATIDKTDVDNGAEQDEDSLNTNPTEKEKPPVTNASRDKEDVTIDRKGEAPKDDSKPSEASSKISKDAAQPPVDRDDPRRPDSADASSPIQDDASALKPEAVVGLDTTKEKEKLEAGRTSDVEKPGKGDSGDTLKASKEPAQRAEADKSTESEAEAKLPQKEEPEVDGSSPISQGGGTQDTGDEEPPASASPPKKRRGRPPGKSPGKKGRPKSPKSPGTAGKAKKLGRPRKYAAKDLDISGDSAVVEGRPKRSTKPVLPFSVASYIDAQKETKRRSSRKSPSKKSSLKEAESSSEEEFNEDEDNKIVDLKPTKKKRGRRERSPETRTTEDEPIKKPRLARSASKKARAGIEATLFEEGLPDSYSESDHVTSDDDKGDESDEAVDMERDNQSIAADSKSGGDPPSRYPRRASAGKAAGSDPEDDLPLSVLIESAKCTKTPNRSKRRGRRRNYAESEDSDASHTSKGGEDDDDPERVGNRLEKRTKRRRPSQPDGDAKDGEQGNVSNTKSDEVEGADENKDNDTASKSPLQNEANATEQSQDDNKLDESDLKGTEKKEIGDTSTEGVEEAIVDHAEKTSPVAGDGASEVEREEPSSEVSHELVSPKQEEGKANQTKTDGIADASISLKSGAKAKLGKGEEDSTEREEAEDVDQGIKKKKAKGEDEKSASGEKSVESLSPEGNDKQEPKDKGRKISSSDKTTGTPKKKSKAKKKEDVKSRTKSESELPEKDDGDDTPWAIERPATAGTDKAKRSPRHAKKESAASKDDEGKPKEAPTPEKAKRSPSRGRASAAKDNSSKDDEDKPKEAPTPEKAKRSPSRGRASATKDNSSKDDEDKPKEAPTPEKAKRSPSRGRASAAKGNSSKDDEDKPKEAPTPEKAKRSTSRGRERRERGGGGGRRRSSRRH